MKLFTVSAGNFYADGGAMFGVVPKVIWSKVYPADERNLCKVALRSLLIDLGDRIFLIDNGCGNKLNDKFYKNNLIDQSDNLINNLSGLGYQAEQITDVILSHLHFDHCGGSTYKDDSGNLQLTFPNATYYTTQKQWDNLLEPTNPREGSALFKDDVLPVHKAGQLKYIEEGTDIIDKVIGFGIYDGHTPGQIIPWVKYRNRKIHFTADLVPLSGNIPTAWVASYDSYPVTSMEEKVKFLSNVHANNELLFFQHDFYTECAEVIKTEKGFKAGNKGKLKEFINNL